jgi:hypothetical protein
MYRLGTRARKHHTIAIGFLVAALLVALGVFVYKSLNFTTAPVTKITNDSATTTRYSPETTKKIAVNEPQFSMELPADWEKVAPTGTPVEQAPYNYSSPSADARQLTLYVGTVPTNVALNKVVVVAAKGNVLEHENVSDNCAEYTQPDKANPGSGVAKGKWRGVEFLCDLANYRRNLVGTASTEGLNQVALTGTTVGTKKVFFTYTDNSASPDYTVFYAVLESFKLK